MQNLQFPYGAVTTVDFHTPVVVRQLHAAGIQLLHVENGPLQLREQRLTLRLDKTTRLQCVC